MIRYRLLVSVLWAAAWAGCATAPPAPAAPPKVIHGQVTTRGMTFKSGLRLVVEEDPSSAVIAPYYKSKLKVTISCISVDAAKKATVKWSVTRNGTANSGTVTLPTALAVAGSVIILAEASYAYKPIVGYNITGTINLADKMYMSPRITAPTYGTTTCT